MPDYQQFGLVKSAHLLPSAKLDDQKYEFIFVLDHSGSMSCGTRMELAKQACVMFLRSLPTDCYFNIIPFETNYRTLFPQSARYSQETLDKAIAFANGLSPMGQNEMELPLLHVYRSPGILGYMTQIFVLTDGCQEFGSSRIDKIVKVIDDNRARGRVFSIGIGEQASKELVTRIAETGAGTSLFVLGNDTIQSKVLAQLRTALKSPLLQGILIKK